MEGVYHVLPTPFEESGALDEEGLERLVDSAVEAGVDGLTVLGVTGEAHKLTDAEQRRVLELVERRAEGVRVVVGASRNSAVAAIEAVEVARSHGADAVMMTPPNFLGAGPGLTAFFREVAAATETPIMLQDFPEISGVSLSPRDMIELAAEVPAIQSIKLEGRPTGRKTAQVREASEIPILGGLGGSYLLSELEAGSNGAMTGFPFPAVLVEIVRAWGEGDRAAAMRTYCRFLPAFVADGQPQLGLAFRKHALRRRGLIECDGVRTPGPTLSAEEKRAADELLDFLELL